MTINRKIQHLLDEIIAAKTSFGRENDKIVLLAVSKTFSASKIREAFQAGIRTFGENYLQEAITKQKELTDLDITWHFIGPIQSNKSEKISKHFDWVHTLTREKEAIMLNQHRPSDSPPLNVCVQINLNAEASKSGLLLEDVVPFCNTLKAYPKLKLRGIMAIPKVSTDFKVQCEQFKKLLLIFNELKTLYAVDTLSMGMSNDFKAAIKEGSTLIRIGSAIFGERQKI